MLVDKFIFGLWLHPSTFMDHNVLVISRIIPSFDGLVGFIFVEPVHFMDLFSYSSYWMNPSS